MLRYVLVFAIESMSWDSIYIWTRVFLEHHSPASGIIEPSLHVFQLWVWFERGKEGDHTRQFERGGH